MYVRGTCMARLTHGVADPPSPSNCQPSKTGHFMCPPDKNKDDFQLQPLTQAELNEIIRKHQMFLSAKPGGARALLRDRDLTGLSFMGQNLSQSDFTGCIMAGCDLTNANFESSTLFGCDFTNAKMTNTRLVRADMRGAEIGMADLAKADMTGADLREGKTVLKRKVKSADDQFSLAAAAGIVQFNGSDLSGAVLNGATASSADFTDAKMVDAQLLGANLKDAVLMGADLSKARLDGADLRNADFSYAMMNGATLANSEKFGSVFTLTLTEDSKGTDINEFDMTLDELILRHMTWVGSGGRQGKRLDLLEVDMRKGPTLAAKKLTAMRAVKTTFAEMDLRGIEMQSCVLEASDFRKCQMQNADLRGANMRSGLFNRTNLANANLNPLQFKRADGVEYRIPCTFDDAVMRYAVFTGARLMQASFRKADVCGADFSNCDLRGADFTGASLKRTQFDGAILDGAIFDQ